MWLDPRVHPIGEIMTKSIEQYISEYADMHKTGEYLTAEGKKKKTKSMFDGVMYIRDVHHEVRRYVKARDKSFIMLDYGCGKARQVYERRLPAYRLIDGKKQRINVTLHETFGRKLQSLWLYDPAVEEYKTPPPAGMKFDVVVCTDVMEHIAEPYVDQVLSDLFSHVAHDGAAFFSISGAPATKHFLDGENLHCTVRDFEFWQNKIREHSIDKQTIYVEHDAVARADHSGATLRTIWRQFNGKDTIETSTTS